MKKTMSYIIIFLLILNNIGIGLVKADFVPASTSSIWSPSSSGFEYFLSGSTFLSSSRIINVNPGEGFSIRHSALNSGFDVNNVYMRMSFSNNAGFTFKGSKAYTAVGSVSYYRPKSAHYNSATGLYTPIYTGGIVPSGTSVSLYSDAATGALFEVSPNITTYQNDYEIYMEGNKVSDSSLVSTKTFYGTVYANVKPHITDYYFENSTGSSINQVQGSNAEPINLVLKVKDFNGCSNIDGGNIRADLTQLGLNSSEVLSYVSCDSDGKTAIFKKTGITTNSPMGTYNFTPSNFVATDEDGNQNMLVDPNTDFDLIDKTASYPITVNPASAPNVTLISNSYYSIGGSLKSSTTFSFSGTQNGSVKIVTSTSSLASTDCSLGTVLQNWTAGYTAYSSYNYTLNSSQLSNGNNYVYACLKNSGGNIGSILLNINKDTTSPYPSLVVFSATSIISTDSSINYKCSENGSYEVRKGGTGIFDGVFVSSGVVSAGVNIPTVPLSNSLFSTGANTVYSYCIDDAGNYGYSTGIVNKADPTPAMGTINSLSDNDIDYDGLDGRDITISWDNTSANSFGYFDSYRVYVLPAATSLDVSTGSTQTAVKYLYDKSASSVTLSGTVLNDSLGNPLVTGSYKVCMAIMGTTAQLGTPSCSSVATLTSDTTSKAQILSAKFTSATNLEITTDTTLDTNLASHNATLFSYNIGGTTYNGTSISGVSGTKINITVPSVPSLSSTGSSLVMSTGALHGAGGGYNNYFSSGSIVISDGQSPTVSGLNISTTPYSTDFYSGSISVNYTFGERMNGSNTKFVFDRISGNSSIQKVFNLTGSTDLTSGSHNVSLNLSTIGLVSGTRYNMTIVGQDMAGNTVTSAPVTVYFDNLGPVAPVLNDRINTSDPTPVVSWGTSVDDFGNGAGTKEFVVKIYNNNNCSSTPIQTYDTIMFNQVVGPLTNGTYSFRVEAKDYLGNISSSVACDSFLVDNTVASISTFKIVDTAISSVSFTKTGNPLTISAELTNTDINHIWIDIQALAGNSSYSNLKCSDAIGPVSCNYTSGVVTYTFNAGFAGTISQAVRQAILTVTNTSQTYTGTAIASISVDNTAPTIGTFTKPVSSQYYGGNSLNVDWSGISDSNFDYLKFEYSSNGGTTYTLIGTGSNSLTYAWNTTSLSSGNNYKFRITSYDRSGNSSITESSTFGIDKDNPTISAGTITTPNSTQVIKGGSSYNILWNTGTISDATSGIKTNSIKLEYSSNAGTSWTTIADNLANNGTYSWTVPSINSNQMKIRLTALDNAGNSNNLVTTGNFVIDSTNPNINVTYAGGGVYGGAIPPNGSKISSSGIDLVFTTFDDYASGVYYKVENLTTSTSWNGTSFVAGNNWVNICNDSTVSGNSNACSNISTGVIFTVNNGENYRLTLKVVDEAGNQTTSTPVDYVGDTISPNISITNSSGSYFSGSVNISGTSSDLLSGVSSVKISIKKGSMYWDGASWVAGVQKLSTNTSDNYANWNYAFNALSGDDESTPYEITAYAYDKSYKVNNEGSSSINLILDKTSPNIQSNLFTFNTGSIYSGGQTINITWNPALITDTGSDLATNPIRLSYNFGTGVSVIADNLPNTGSYSFVLPMVDSPVSRFLISAKDKVSNQALNISSDNFIVDSTDPTIQSVKTKGDAIGGINGLIVTFSERIKNPGTLPINSIFSVSDGITLNSTYTHSEVSMQTIVELNFNSSYTGTSLTPTLYYIGGIIEDLASRQLAGGNKVSLDNAEPRILNTKIFDVNSNGKFDKIEVKFSEPLVSTTDLTAFNIIGSLVGMSKSSLSISGDTATLNLNESTNYSTNPTGMTLNFTSNSNWKDSSNNVAGSLGTPINFIDNAKPILVSSILKDTGFVADKVELGFSEDLTGSVSGFSINTGSILSQTLSPNDKITLNVSGITGTNPNVNLDYLGTLQDTNGNNLDTISGKSIKETISPKMLSSYTIDQNNNGKIDAIVASFSETLSGTFADFTVNVPGYVLKTPTTYSLSGSSDVVVYLEEKTTYDTDGVPSLNLVSNTSLLDASSNAVIPQSVTSQDRVGPVITSARFDESTSKLYLNFSESVTGSLSNSDFVLNGASAVISGVNFVGGDSSAVLDLSSTGVVYGTSEISFASNLVGDNSGNKQSNTYFSKISASVIINEVMTSGDVKYIELKNISSSSVDISGWTLENLLGVGANYTIGASQTIPANGYYLISTTDAYFSGAVSNQTALLNISSDISLKNGSVLVDSFVNQTPTSNTSFERVNGCGNGLSNSCWYLGVSSNYFVSSTYKGTPKNDNVTDNTSPVISGFTPATNTIFPGVGNIQVGVSYSDTGVGIDTSNYTATLEKFDGVSWNASSGMVGSGIVTSTGANFDLSGISSYGRYRLVFDISDLAGNSVTQNIEFYVDNFTVEISTGSLNIGNLTSNTQKLTGVLNVQVKTIGSSFTLNNSYVDFDLPNWDGTKGFGGCVGGSCTVLENFKAKQIASEPVLLQTNGNLNTYTYQIKYGALIDENQVAGNYTSNNSLETVVSY